MQFKYLSISPPPTLSPVPRSFPTSTSTVSPTATPNRSTEPKISTLTLYPASDPPSLNFSALEDEDSTEDLKYDIPTYIHALFPSIIWREPPNKDFFRTILLGRSGPISTFYRARVTVSADWVGEGDQGGLFLWMNWNASTSGTRQRWFKAGIQVTDGQACESVVATDDWSDWSSGPVRDDVDKGFGGGAKITLEIERDREGTGSKWLSGVSVYIVEGEKRRKIRQCTWFFEGVDESKRILVAIYANKPSQDDRRELLVQFEDFVITRRDAA